MKKNVLLKICEDKSLFSHSFEYCENDSLIFVSIKNRKRALRKIARKFNSCNIIIPEKDSYYRILEGVISQYKSFSCEAVFPIINKICRKVGEKYSLKFPLEEVFVLAEPTLACRIIHAIKGSSKLFSVISGDESIFRMYDELYFSTGTVVRQLPSLATALPEDSIIIRTEHAALSLAHNIPVIDISNSPLKGDNIIAVNEIAVFGSTISEIEKIVGKAGLPLYHILNEIPGKDAVINLDSCADKIFLLDTGEI